MACSYNDSKGIKQIVIMNVKYQH